MVESARTRLTVLLAEIKRHFDNGTTPPEELFEEAFNITNNRYMTKHDEFVSEAVRAVEMGHAEMWGYFNDLIQRVEVAVEAEKWNPYPENKPENKTKYIVQLKTNQIDMDFWVDEYGWSLYGKTDVTFFRELPAPYQPEEMGNG